MSEESRLKRAIWIFLVTFFEPNDVDLFKFIELRLFFKDELGLAIDLIEKNTLKPRLKGQILEEAVKV